MPVRGLPAPKGILVIARTTLARRPGGPMALATRSAESRRRMRRVQVDTRLYCGTNGCTTHLELDARSGVATCPICGFSRRFS